MKFLLALALLSSVAMANEHKEDHKADHKEVKTEEVKTVVTTEHKDMKEDKKAAYKAAKEKCLADAKEQGKELKGKELTDCITK